MNDEICGEQTSWTSVTLTCGLEKANHPFDYHYDPKVGAGTRWPTDAYLAQPKIPKVKAETMTFTNNRYL